MLTKLHTLELLPVVEFDPAEFRRVDRDLPGNGADQADYQLYWYDSLADARIVGLEPLQGSWFVPMSALIDPEILRTLALTRIKRHDNQTKDDAPINLDNVGPLIGGFCLRSEGEILIWPGCCSDLGTLSEWPAALAYRGEAWKMVWIGHPWLSVRFDGDHLVFSERHESDDPVARYRIEPSVLQSAIDAAEVGIKQFEDRLLAVVEGIVPRSQARDVARILVRGHGPVGS